MFAALPLPCLSLAQLPPMLGVPWVWPWTCRALCLCSWVTLPSHVISACFEALHSDPEPELANSPGMLSQTPQQNWPPPLGPLDSGSELDSCTYHVLPYITSACLALSSLQATNSQGQGWRLIHQPLGTWDRAIHAFGNSAPGSWIQFILLSLDEARPLGVILRDLTVLTCLENLGVS